MEEPVSMSLRFLAQRCGALVALAALITGCASVAPTTEAPLPVPAVTETPVVVEVAPPRPTPPPPPAAEPAPATPPNLEPRIRSRLDPLDDASSVDLWDRVRQGFAMPDLDTELVRKWEQYYAQRPDYVQRMTARGSRYLFHIVEEIDRRGMPTDLALLPFIESAFDPQARSAAKAAGMWQFMPGTGREYELTQNLFRDDRRDILASTRAALDYLQRLHGMFNDWHLALAAYNWGQGNVQKALARNAKTGKAGDYQNLRMPDETRNYVPKLQAIKNIVAKPESFSLVLPPLDNHPYFITVAIERDIDVILAASLSGLTLEQFQQLNPQLNKPVILAAGTPQILLPYDNANRFLRSLDDHDGPMASWTAWVAPRTLKPMDAARHVGMTEAELREVNRIPARMLVKAGSTLLVPRSAKQTEDVAEHLAENGNLTLAPEAKPQRKLQVKVGRKGESVASLARRHGMTASQLAAANGVAATARFKPGQLVTVLLPTRKATSNRTAQKRPAVKRKAGTTVSAVKPVAKTTGSRSVKPANKSRPRAKKPGR
jgi:membrane-bound lytic murein transglycosylase D